MTNKEQAWAVKNHKRALDAMLRMYAEAGQVDWPLAIGVSELLAKTRGMNTETTNMMRAAADFVGIIERYLIRKREATE